MTTFARFASDAAWQAVADLAVYAFELSRHADTRRVIGIDIGTTMGEY